MLTASHTFRKPVLNHCSQTHRHRHTHAHTPLLQRQERCAKITWKQARNKHFVANLAFIMSRRELQASLSDKLLSSPQMQAHSGHIILTHGLELLWGDEAGVGVRRPLCQHLPDGSVGGRAVSEGLLHGLVLQLLPSAPQTDRLQYTQDNILDKLHCLYNQTNLLRDTQDNILDKFHQSHNVE